MNNNSLNTFWDFLRYPEFKMQLEIEGKVPPEPIVAKEIDKKN